MAKTTSTIGWIIVFLASLGLLAWLNDKLHWLWYGLGGLVALVLLFYLLVPLLIKNMMSMNVNAPAEDIDPAEFPEHIADYFDRVGRSLEAMGFLDLGTFRLDGMVPNIRSGFRLMAHSQDDTLAMLTWIQTYVKDEPQPDQTYLEFATELTDDRNLNTNDGKDLPSVDQNPNKVAYVFLDPIETEILWAIHRGMANEEARGTSTRPVPMDKSPAELFRQEFSKELEEKVNRGYWTHGEREGLYRPTLKGAYLMTWSELPPFKAIRLNQARRRSTQLRDRLGL